MTEDRVGTTVEFRAVTKDYAGQRALANLSLALRPGEMLAMLGPSGCGKTTALRSLAGLEQITSGSILIDGEDVSYVPTNKRDIGMVFQSYSLFPHLTVRENVEFGLRMRKVSPKQRQKRAAESLDLVGLGHLSDRYSHQLSGGQQQRVALARALVTRPRVLLLDEPLSALDAKVRVQLREEIKSIHAELGMTTLFVTHDQEEALAVADRVAVMRDGQIEQVATPEALYSVPESPFVAEFVGLSNRLSGVVRGSTVVVHGAALPAHEVLEDGASVTVYIRPENIEFASEGVFAIVRSSSFLGSLRRTLVELTSGELLSVQHSAHERLLVGDAVCLNFVKHPVSVRLTAAAS